MRRVLNPTGAMFLHCDSTADACLGILCDAVFGAADFRNRIVCSVAKSKGGTDHPDNLQLL